MKKPLLTAYAVLFAVYYLFMSGQYYQLVLATKSIPGALVGLAFVFVSAFLLKKELAKESKAGFGAYLGVFIGYVLIAVFSQVMADMTFYDFLQYGVKAQDILYNFDENPEIVKRVSQETKLFATLVMFVDVLNECLLFWLFWRFGERGLRVLWPKSKVDATVGPTQVT